MFPLLCTQLRSALISLVAVCVYCRDPLATSKFIPSGMPTDHPYNKDGYRYILVESDPHTPGRQAFEESMESQLNKPMMVPAQFYRLFICNQVMLAVQDRG